ncbi:unnamed protein product [Acanthoscelides obtectus]|uniref:Peptidase M10 metallopeptidase domain-containing protein n=1 Tax=Acanthoscelides obtectus TaxID=200917 RepID=A0A9P0KWH5_ACAOB|nr:unnamed protein product [Acanthoscelides obtectus]CAK1676837.1 Putative metalloproteinase 165R [Acanthoscelides obtectus]
MGNDECPLTLDDAGGVLGHAYFPDSSGTCREIHLDINERWYFGNNPNIPKNQTSFLMVLVHEIGHALGIAHSASPNAIMFAFYQHEIRGLDVDDINAVQYLYGRKNKYDSIPTSTTASAIPKTTTTIRSTTHRSQTGMYDEVYCKFGNAVLARAFDSTGSRLATAEVVRRFIHDTTCMRLQVAVGRFGLLSCNIVRSHDCIISSADMHGSQVLFWLYLCVYCGNRLFSYRCKVFHKISLYFSSGRLVAGAVGFVTAEIPQTISREADLDK